MLRILTRFRRLAFVSSVAASVAGCSSSEPTKPVVVDITGNYVATIFKVTPTGKPTIDVLARGGSLVMTIGADGATSGNLVIPQDVFGSSVSASMVGTVSKSGYSVRFTQASDTFVRTVGWLAGGGTIATDVNDGSARIEVLLTRQ